MEKQITIGEVFEIMESWTFKNWDMEKYEADQNGFIELRKDIDMEKALDEALQMAVTVRDFLLQFVKSE
jgi:hypothetical protein